MLRVKSVWTGFTGSPGFTNFYFGYTSDLTGANSAVTATQQFWDQVHTALPAGVAVQASQEVEVVDPANGDLLSTITATAASPSWVGTVAGPYAAPVGAVINWKTSAIHSGRRVRGRVFLVPLGGDRFQSDGTLLDATRTQLLSAGNNLATGALSVWARPKGPPPVVAGAEYDVNGVSVPDKACILRSRRD